MLRKSLNALYKLSGWSAALFVAGICLIVITQVVLNLVDKAAGVILGSSLGLTIPSYADFTGFFLAAASFLALAYTLREGGHIRVTLFIQHFSPGVRHFLEIWCVGLAVAIVGYFAWYTGLLVNESYGYGDMSSGMVPVPLWIPQLSMLFGLVVLFIALVDELVALLSGNDPSYTGKGENLLEDKAISSVDWAEESPREKN